MPEVLYTIKSSDYRYLCPLLSVGLGVATLCVGLLVRVLVTFCVVLFAGFNMKEKIFISLAWMPKATVQVSLDENFIEIIFSLLCLQRSHWHVFQSISLTGNDIAAVICCISLHVCVFRQRLAPRHWTRLAGLEMSSYRNMEWIFWLWRFLRFLSRHRSERLPSASPDPNYCSRTHTR